PADRQKRRLLPWFQRRSTRPFACGSPARKPNLQDDDDIGEDSYQEQNRGPDYPFVSEIVGDCAAQGGRQVLPQLVPRLFLARPLQHQGDEAGENEGRKPIRDGFPASLQSVSDARGGSLAWPRRMHQKHKRSARHTLSGRQLSTSP